MDEERKRELQGLSPEQRRQWLESGLRVRREEREQLEREQERQRSLTVLAPVLEAIHDRTSQEAAVLEDDAEIVAWIARNFPFPMGGSTCDWSQVPSSKTILTPAPVAMKNA